MTKIPIKGYSCRKMVSTYTYICAMFSHSKIFDVPSVNVPVLMSKEECSQILETGFYINEKQHAVKINKQGVTKYKLVTNGALHWYENDVKCEGGSVQIEGVTHKSIIELKEVSIYINSIELDYNKETKFCLTLL